MTHRDDLLDRVKSVNPVSSDRALPGDLADSRPPLALLIREGTLADTQTEPAASKWRGPAVAAAALLIALLIAVPILMLGGNDTPVGQTTAAPTTTEASTTVPLSTTAAPAETVAPAASMMTWQRIEQDSLSPGVIWDITAGGPGLVAVGQDRMDGFEIDAVVWLSADGRFWERIEDPEVFGGPGGQYLLGVSAGPVGILAHGEDGGQTAIWFSPDGSQWSRLDVDAIGTPGQTRLTVRLGESGLVAFDNDQSPGDAVFVSTNGIDWAPVTESTQIADILASVEESDDIDLPRHGVPAGGLYDENVAANGDLIMSVTWHTRISIWISDDEGATWHQVDPDDPAFLDNPVPHSQTVVAFGGGFVVVGTSGGDAAVWIGESTG